MRLAAGAYPGRPAGPSGLHARRYNSSLKFAKESVACIPGKIDRAEAKGILQGLIESGVNLTICGHLTKLGHRTKLDPRTGRGPTEASSLTTPTFPSR